MSIFEAILLGVIQGITEFLPISSTGHLTLAGKFMNLISNEHPEHWTAFIAIMQLGTLVSILVYFAKDIINIVKDFFVDNLFKRIPFKQQSLNSRLGWFIIIGSIPVVVVGLAFKDIIEGALTKNLYVIATSLIVLAVILAIAEKAASHKKELEKITVKDSIIIGISQAFALIPGSSRSGTTLTGGLFTGLTREAAARFSFLLSIPAIFGSGIFQIKEAIEYLDESMTTALIISTIVSAVSGYLAIDFLIKFLKSHSTFIFIYYRIILGIIILILLFTNTIQP